MSAYQIRIREATMKDAALIADISRETFYEAIAPFNTKENMDKFMGGDFSREKLMSEVGEDGHIFLLAYWKDQPSGYLKLRQNKAPEALRRFATIEIARIYVSQQAIGLGLGKALMQKSIDLAGAMEKEVLWLGVWEHNQKAIAFYTQWGFERFGEHIFMLGDDAQTDWLMKKTLRVF
jgi:ribosomal protein S18 acetylase RimI-like enzyme